MKPVGWLGRAEELEGIGWRKRPKLRASGSAGNEI